MTSPPSHACSGGSPSQPDGKPTLRIGRPPLRVVADSAPAHPAPSPVGVEFGCAKPRLKEEQEKGGVMPLSGRTLWIGATLAIVAAVIVVFAVFAGGGGSTGY